MVQDQVPLPDIILERVAALALDLLVLGIACACVLVTVIFVAAVVGGAIAELRSRGAGVERYP